MATKCISDRELSVAKESMALLSNFSCWEDSETPVLFQAPILPILKEMAQDSNEVVRLRVYEVMVKVAAESPKNLEMYVKKQKTIKNRS